VGRHRPSLPPSTGQAAGRCRPSPTLDAAAGPRPLPLPWRAAADGASTTSSGATTSLVLAPAQPRRVDLCRPGPDSSLPCTEAPSWTRRYRLGFFVGQRRLDLREPRRHPWRASGLDGVRRCDGLDVSEAEGLRPLCDVIGLNRMAGCGEDRLIPSSLRAALSIHRRASPSLGARSSATVTRCSGSLWPKGRVWSWGIVGVGVWLIGGRDQL
jgi:hypothetical protein